MDNQKKVENGREGRLPAMAPLANPYVPFQLETRPSMRRRRDWCGGRFFPGWIFPSWAW